jgi:hypothetical protein
MQTLLTAPNLAHSTRLFNRDFSLSPHTAQEPMQFKNIPHAIHLTCANTNFQNLHAKQTLLRDFNQWRNAPPCKLVDLAKLAHAIHALSPWLCHAPLHAACKGTNRSPVVARLSPPSGSDTKLKLEELIHTTQNVFHCLTNKWRLHI